MADLLNEHFANRLHDLQQSLRRNPADLDLQQAMGQWLDAHSALFEAFVSPEALQFGIGPEKRDRRLRFLRHLLLHGFLPPRVEEHPGTPQDSTTVNFGVVTSYFYPHTFSLLEAGLANPDVAVFAAYPATSGDHAWIELHPEGKHVRVSLRRALMLEGDGLVWRYFKNPVPIHYLFPVDNYYRSKFHLVRMFDACEAPMPGSTIIREVCENKALLHEIAGDIPGLQLACELRLHHEDQDHQHTASLDRFIATHKLQALVTKPVDGFGGADVHFWELPAQRDALLNYVQEALKGHDELLAQGRIVPVPTKSGREWNLRQYVLREGPATIRSQWKRVRIGSGVLNTTQGARSITAEQLLPDLDLDDDQRASFLAALRSTDALATDVLRALEAYLQRVWQHNRQRYRGSGSNLEPDLLALDFMIAHDPTRANGFAVYLNEINDFASGGMRDYEVLLHRQSLPDAEVVRATQEFSLAPHILATAHWRGSAYKEAVQPVTSMP